MRKLLPLALTIGLSAVGFAQDSNTCMCTSNGDTHTRMMNGKVIQEDKHTINVITPAPGNTTVTSYYASPNSVSTYDMSADRDVKVHVDENGTVVQSDKTTINKIKPAPSNYAMLSDGYVMTPASNGDVRVRVDSHGNVIQTDKTTINKITPSPSSETTTVVTHETTTTDYRD